ncbi:enoyl-CoA hydratase-related protein [Pseudonocardia dioxanivorans]|uniref:enoyl-CoA hydratase-related protein n=1 Tax=Pseudonocardia dioxanivorans TaxID=240495 RepID=UPI000CD11E8E|nr:enoyl-CoA hydratase-related protein [Pseudonocardia dioxanivorans]
MTSSGTVLAQRHGGVLLLTLNRPSRLNAWNAELETRYLELLAGAAADPDVRAIVLTGAGRGFCAGADLDELSGVDTLDPADLDGRRLVLPNLRTPLIAAINGAAAGLGLVVALSADVRFCVPEAKLTTAFARRGLIAEYGVAWVLPRLVGTSRALDLLLSGRVVRGEEAARIGLVDHLATPATLVDAALAYAADLAENCSPTSMAIMKDQVRAALDEPFDVSLDRSDVLMREAFRRTDVKEGVAAHLEKRAPRFAPLP